jgi:hypothetical protein
VGAAVAAALAGIVAPDWLKSFLRGEFRRGSGG